MTRIQELRTILNIIEKYNPDTSEPIIPEHDILYFPILTNDVSEEDSKILEECGCFIDEETDGWAQFV